MADHGNIDLDAVRDTLVAVALEAGHMMLSCDHTNLGLDTKKNPQDLVTVVDKAIETMVAKKLRAAYPTFEFMGEETYKPGDKVSNAPTFIVDPIDGTTNFVSLLPMACISLSMAINRASVVGVIYNPWLDYLYSARRGGGAWLHCPRRIISSHAQDHQHHAKHPDAEKAQTSVTSPQTGPIPPTFHHTSDATHQTIRLPLRPGGPLDVSTSLVSVCGDGWREGPYFDIIGRQSQQLTALQQTGGGQCRGKRNFGSSAVELAFLAAGQLDAWWQVGCWVWDVCGAWIIVEEAGGMIVGYNPDNWKVEIDDRLYLAIRPAPKSEQEKLVKQLWALMGDDRIEI